MRIAVDALSVLPNETGGGEVYLASLLRAMEEPPPGRDHTVTVHCTERSRGLFREAGAVRLAAHPLDNRSRARRLLFEHLRLAARLDADGADVLFAPGNALPLRVRCASVLGIQSLHSFLVPEEMSPLRVRYFRWIVPRSARRADRVLCVSDDLRRTLLRVVPGLDAAKVRVVHEGAPEDVARVEDAAALDAECARHGVRRDRFVLFVSSLNPFKRPERAVAAVARIRRERGEEWPLVLAGRASEEHRARVLATAAAEGATDLVRIAGVQDRAALSRLYSAARAFVYPSAVETWGLPPLEAMRCRCPVVASDRTSVPEVCGDAALLVDPDDVAALAAALCSALHDETVRAALIERGAARAASLTWRASALGTYALLEEAAALRDGAPSAAFSRP